MKQTRMFMILTKGLFGNFFCKWNEFSLQWNHKRNSRGKDIKHVAYWVKTLQLESESSQFKPH